MRANRSVCRSFVVIIQPQRWSCRKHVSIINRNGSYAESTLSLFDLNVGFTTNDVADIRPQGWSPCKHVSIINRNGSHAESTLSLFDPQRWFHLQTYCRYPTTTVVLPQACLPISDRKVCGLYIPFSERCVKQLSTLHRGLGIGSGQTLAPFALSERKAKYPNKDQNTPAQENDRIFSGCTEKTANGTRIITDREVRFSFSYNFSSRQKRYCPHHAIHEERFWKFPYRKRNPKHWHACTIFLYLCRMSYR